MEQALNICGLNKSIRKKQILYNVDLQVNIGEAMGLIGANGAGKSSLIKCIARLWHGDSGKITIYGNDVKKNFKRAMSHTGFLIEYPKMFEELSAVQNLKYISSYCNIKISDTEIKNNLDIVGLEKAKDKKLKTYSSGMYQRACIAALLIRNPKLLILDEPTATLDPKSIVDLRNILNTIKKNSDVSMLVSSHNLHEVEKICDRVTIIDHGKILDVKNMKSMENNLKIFRLEFKDNSVAAYAKKYTANIEFTDIKEEDKYLVLKGCAESFQKFVAICKLEIVNFTIEETLEEDFLKILQGERK